MDFAGLVESVLISVYLRRNWFNLSDFLMTAMSRDDGDPGDS